MIVFKGKIVLILIFLIGVLMGPSVQQTLPMEWTDYAQNPVFDPQTKAYYPTVIYDVNAFGGHGYSYYYKMWYDNASEGGITLAGSDDGISWTIVGPVSGLKTPRHGRIVYNPSGFGGGIFYKIWYWDYGADLYSINAMRYAESSDGLSWANDQPLTQNPTAQLVTGAGSGWNRGSYGPMHVLFKPSASNTGSPMNYSYVMYFDGTTGGTEEVGLAYSTDGKYWSLHSKVLSLGSSGSWDEHYACFGTVLFFDGLWHMWYSGGRWDTGGMGTTGIGYATSPDGITWTKYATNPLTSLGGYGTFGGIGNASTWNEKRNYTPMVLYDASNFSEHGEGCELKMWRSGVSASSNYTIGYASLCLSPPAPTLVSPINGATNVCPLSGTSFDWNDSQDLPPISYRIQLSTLDTFATTVFDVSGLASSGYAYGGTLSPNTTYWWRVNATSPHGTSGWSSVWSFTTGSCSVTINPTRYLPYFSLRPLAENRIGEANELRFEVENLLKLAGERGLDASQCKTSYEKGLNYLSNAKKFLSGNNFAAANTYAIYAEREFLKARDCLKSLLGY